MNHSKTRHENKKIHLIIAISVSIVLWTVMFTGIWPFWPMMILSTSILIIIYAFYQGNPLKEFDWNLFSFVTGILSALLLYILFYLGKLSLSVLWPTSSEQINAVYTFKKNIPTLIISLTLIFPIGFGEEIFWRGLIQKRLSSFLGDIKGMCLTTIIYSAVHIPSQNWILCLAAFTCGLFWGMIYLQSKNLLSVVISHILWDILIFSVFPL